MRHYLIPIVFLLGTTAVLGADLHAQLMECRLHKDATARLGCYDALVVPRDTVHHLKADERSAAWHDIALLEQARTPESPLFMLNRHESNDTLTLTRPAQRGATLAIGCASSITHIRVRLDAPWVGDSVAARVDGREAGSHWFVRDNGLLLEFGRGLPAIEELLRWQLGHELTLQDEGGSVLRVELDGLTDALDPLRQQCRW